MYTPQYVLDCINKYCNLAGQELTEWNFDRLVFFPLKEAECFTNLQMSSGVTKGVLLIEGCNFVIKMPFYGSERDEEYVDGLGYTEAMEVYGSDWSSREVKCELYPFENAAGETPWDYCSAEAQIYQYAEEEGVEQFFAKTEFLGYAQGWPVYIQERAVMYRDMDAPEHSSKHLSYINRELLARAFSDLAASQVADLVAEYNEEAFQRLDKFCEDYSVTDLHQGNIGYLHGKPVLVDYSSYDD